MVNRSHRRANVMPLKVQSKLTQAVVRGDVPLVKQEILNGEDQNGSDSCLRTYLHLACHFGRNEVVKCLLSVSARVNSKDSNWLTPLHYACRKNYDDVVATLIDHDADIECRDKMWVTPLHVCAANNSLESAELFVDRIKNINVSDRSGATALHHAAFNGNCDMITFLLKKGCEPNAFDKKSRRPLHYAAAIDNSDSIRLLLQAGATTNAHDKGLKTPLHFAAASGSLNALQTLLDNGADITAVDADGNNALHMASLHGEDDVIEELLNRDIRLINSANKSGMTALHFAAGSDKGLASLELLVRYPANVIHMNARDKQKRTAMHLAAKFARLMCLQELLRHEADPAASDSNMRTPLHYAVATGNNKIIDALLDHPAVDPNIVDSSGMTPLHYAAFAGLSHVVVHLLKHPTKPASPLINDITGRPAHFLAALAGDMDCLKPLVIAYAEYAPISVLDNFDRSPLHYAAAAGASGHDCLQYLLNYDSSADDAESNIAPEAAFTATDAEASQCDDQSHAFSVRSKDGNGNAFSVNQKDIFGRTPLMYACEFDPDGESVELLISDGAKVDAMDSNGIYTINYAAAAGRAAVLRILLQTFYWNEIKFKVCPSHCAAFYGHAECLELLLKEGIFDNLMKAVEYSRRSSSGCFEVLENFVLTAPYEDESLSEISQYFTATDQSFHMQFLSNDTFNDLSQLDPIVSRLSLDQNLTQADDKPDVPAATATHHHEDHEEHETGETNTVATTAIPESEETKSDLPVKVNGSVTTGEVPVPGSECRMVNGFSLNNNLRHSRDTVKSAHTKTSAAAAAAVVVESKESATTTTTMQQLKAAVIS